MKSKEHTDALVQPHATVNVRIAPRAGVDQSSIAQSIPHNLGRFRVLNEIGRGGMGVVLRAYDASLDREVAIKLVTLETDLQFAHEARVTSQLRHPGIMPVYETGSTADGRMYFVMPLISGETLAALLSKRIDFKSGLRRWFHLFKQVCHAVGHAHERGIVHRDLKPGNVMVGSDGRALVMDWGVAAERESSAGEPSGDGCWIFGTPACMPPEQALGKGNSADPRIDVFGLGAILCEILTGEPPYVAADAATVRRMAAAGDLRDCYLRLHESGRPREVIELAIQCLAPDPEARPADGKAVARRLASILTVVRSALPSRVR